MSKKLQKELDNDLKGISAMVQMGLLTLDQLENIFKKMSKKYNMTIIIRNKNRNTNEIIIKTIEA